MNTLERKQRHYKELLNRIEKNRKADATAKHQISLLERKVRTKKLIHAGLVFEEAGILDTYEHDTALAALKNLNKGEHTPL